MEESKITMVEKIKRKNEELLIKYFQEAFGEGHSIGADWGFPTTSIEIKLTTKDEIVTTAIIFNCLTFDYSLKFKAIKIIEGVETPGEGAVDKTLIQFVMDRVNDFNAKFFTTTQLVLQDEAPKEKVKEEVENVELEAEVESDVEMEGETTPAENPLPTPKSNKKTYVKK